MQFIKMNENNMKFNKNGIYGNKDIFVVYMRKCDFHWNLCYAGNACFTWNLHIL